MTDDERRNAALLLRPEVTAGRVDLDSVDPSGVRDAVRSRPVPPLPVRLAERLAMKAGLRTYEGACVKPLVAARRTVLGERASGAPRLLIRVDEFPHATALDEPGRYGVAAFRRFHAILAESGTDYMLAALPRLSYRHNDPEASGGRELDDEEREMLRQLSSGGVEVAVHGLDHRTRDPRPRRRSELLGLTAPQLESRLDAAEAILAELGIRARVFVPPFNRFSRSQYPILASRYEIVCGGPETVVEMGFHRTPLWRGDAMYMPSYPPLYGRAREIRPAVERLIEQQAAIWIPVVLHWGWELEDDFAELTRLAALAAPIAHSWDELLQSPD